MKKARLLIVEDEGLVALSIEKYLTDLGHEVLAMIATGEEAIQKVLETEPDLVIMDIRLHGAMDGVEAARRIKESFHVPVIYVTSYSDEATLERAKNTEPFGYIRKPLDAEMLKISVEMALHTSVVQNQLRRTKEELEAILRSLDEGVIVADIGGSIDYMNQAARRLLSLAETQATSKLLLTQVFRVQDTGTHSEVRIPLSRAVLDGQSVSVANLLLLTNDSRQLPIDFNLVPFRDEQGVTKGVVLSFRDVTERRKMQELASRDLGSRDGARAAEQ